MFLLSGLSTFTFPFPLNALSDVLILTSGATLGGAEVTAALGRINIRLLILTHTYTQCIEYKINGKRHTI